MAAGKQDQINNALYDEYGERWYTAENDPVALLRAEGRARNPWVMTEIRKQYPAGNVQVLDIGCGAGFLANDLALSGFAVSGLDSSEQSLAVARRHDRTGTVDYRLGDACRLPFPTSTFHAVCAMDFLEHVENPAHVIGEAARVLKSDGLFFFHTFNRNLLSWLIVIKGVEWFVPNTPKNMHCLRYFLKPSEIRAMCGDRGLEVVFCRGFMPDLGRPAFWKMLIAGKIGPGFSFRFTRSTLMGYTGMAVRRASAAP
jgi:2-polyprenyl-6-hydroxyphenyl methylase / 3-demethylubiquinone-9 3-methyltransferase